MLLTSVLVTVVCLMVGYVWFRRRLDSRLPPFPVRPLPIVGNLLAMKNDMRPLFKAWRKQCGDIFSLYIGGNLMIVINGYALMKEALAKHGDTLSGRPPVFFDQVTGFPDKGLVFTEGSYWKEQRGVTVAILRSFGLGKNIMADKILAEATSFTTYIESFKGKPIDIQIIVFICVSNVICSILFGQRFEFDDKEFQDLMKTMKELFQRVQTTELANFYPWFEHLPWDLYKAKELASASRKLMEIVTRITKTKQRDVAGVEDINNFIDAYVLEMKKRTDDGVHTYMDTESLYKIILELFEAGTEETSITIGWCVLYMVVYPDIQEKVYQEINDKVGTERPPTMQDKTQLTYLNAVIMETQRLASVLPQSVTHLCCEETTLANYVIPKGACIIPNLDSVLHDTTTWGEDAMSFRPERFIDDNGKLKIPEEFIPFGIGRRSCIGEALAKMQLFLFLSSMFQKFKFLPADPKKPPSPDYISGFVAVPVPYEVIIEERIAS